ncbi:hypothetical protein SUGI_0529710 [Cryptomeria japonica]|uniref:uncharacterized protein LOC131055081 n=1 Tax=Cryptomeria japonica TaxID=3369 RepID=UPI002408CC78|nr:uncharacterized protein LOC131055081 [Cryptomeria japonica]GLJ27022.1 hypothetical protein SUGI_0529710 [Cryptomeria japonica]
MDDPSFEWGKLARLIGLSVALIVLITLSFLDARKAYKKREHWVPGKALVLSALTIQLITLFNGQSTSLRDSDFSSYEGPITPELLTDSLKNDLLMIRIGRVMICVFVAYLLPGMARAASKNYRTRLVALLLTISFQSVSEIYGMNARRNKEYLTNGKAAGSSFTLSTITVLGSIALLLLILSCATFASKSIHDLISQKIPLILKNPVVTDYGSWQSVEDKVLHSWIATRICNPEYIIARSELIAAAGVIVTVCIGASIAGWIMEGTTKHFRSRFDWLKYTTIGLQCLFILIGWAVVCWRWVTAVVYYGRRPSSWKSRKFRMEDFWTRHIVNQVDTDRTELVEKKVSTFKSTRKKIWLPRELLPALILLQVVVVLFSKACWFVSEMIFCNEYFMHWFILKQWKGIGTNEEYDKMEQLLDRIRMPGEKPDGLWVANRAAIRQARALIARGAANGKTCSALVSFIKTKTSHSRAGVRCLSPGNLAPISAILNPGEEFPELKYLSRIPLEAPLEVEKYFVFAGKRCWKMTAVCLLQIIANLAALSSGTGSPRRSKLLTEAVNAYSQAWELMDLVDESDPEVHILSKAADKVYRSLQADIKFRYTWNISPSPNLDTSSTNPLNDVIQSLAKQGKAKADAAKQGHDSVNWKDVAAGNCLYKLCMSVDCSGGDVKEMLEEAQSSLADVMECCLDMVADALVDNCRRWARRFHEKRVWISLYIAGKATAVMANLQRKPFKHRLTPRSLSIGAQDDTDDEDASTSLV